MGMIKEIAGTLGAKAVNGIINGFESLIRGGAKAVQNLSKMSEKQLESIGTQNITPQGGVIYNDKALNKPISMDSKSKANLEHIKNDINLINYEVENPNKTTMRVGTDIVKAIEITNDSNIKSANRIDRKLDSMAIDIYKSLGIVGNGSNYTGSGDEEYTEDSSSSLTNALKYAKDFGIDVAKAAGSTLFKVISKHPIIAATTAGLIITETLVANSIKKKIAEYEEGKDAYSEENKPVIKSSRESIEYNEKRVLINKSLDTYGLDSIYRDEYKLIIDYKEKLEDWVSKNINGKASKVKDRLQKLFDTPFSYNLRNAVSINEDIFGKNSHIKSILDTTVRNNVKLKDDLTNYLRGIILYISKSNNIELDTKDKSYYDYNKFEYDFSDFKGIIRKEYEGSGLTDKELFEDLLGPFRTHIKNRDQYNIDLSTVKQNGIANITKSLTVNDLNESKDEVGVKELEEIIYLVDEFRNSVNDLNKSMKISLSIYEKLISLPKIEKHNLLMLGDLCYEIFSILYNNLRNPKLKSIFSYMINWFTPQDKDINSLIRSFTVKRDALDNAQLSDSKKGNSTTVYLYALFATLFYSYQLNISRSVKDENSTIAMKYWFTIITNSIKSDSTSKDFWIFYSSQFKFLYSVGVSLTGHEGTELIKKMTKEFTENNKLIDNDIKSGKRDIYGDAINPKSEPEIEVNDTTNESNSNNPVNPSTSDLSKELIDDNDTTSIDNSSTSYGIAVLAQGEDELANLSKDQHNEVTSKLNSLEYGINELNRKWGIQVTNSTISTDKLNEDNIVNNQ